MDRAKALGALVVLLVVLFAVGVGAGATRRGGDRPLLPTGGGALLESLKWRLAADDLNAPCLNRARRELTVAPNGTCRVTVPGSWYPVRRLALRLKTGAATATLQQKDALPDTRSLVAGTPAEWDVYTNGASLLLACASAGSCTVEVR